MKIIHHLKAQKSGARKHHVIPVGTPDFFTLHEKYHEEKTHKGFLLETETTVEEGKYVGHGFGILVEPEDIGPFIQALEKLKEITEAENTKT